MTIKNFKDAFLKDIEGNVIKENDKPVELKTLAIKALLDVIEQVDADEKAKRFTLAAKLAAHDEVDLSAEEIVKIKHCVGKGYMPLQVGRVNEFLEA